MLLCRISWMNAYTGFPDSNFIPVGSNPKRYGYGGECWNFRQHRGRVRGYVRLQSPEPDAVLRRLRARQRATGNGDVTVVWVSTKDTIADACIVGWYRNATVHAEERFRPEGKALSRQLRSKGVARARDATFPYYMSCGEDDAVLLHEANRNFPVPVEAGWMAKASFLFYPDGGQHPDELLASHEDFKARVDEYITSHAETDPANKVLLDEVPEDFGVEGKQRMVTHWARERDGRVANRAKDRFRQKHGRLFCEACRFDFRSVYGKLGDGYVEAHHTRPLSDGIRKTRLRDFMMLCANCHRMAHRLIGQQGPLTRRETKRGLQGASPHA